MYEEAKALSQVSNTDAKKYLYEILFEMGEKLPRTLQDESLHVDMNKMNTNLDSIDDEAILGTAETDQNKVLLLMKVYAILTCILQFGPDSSLLGSTSLRMLELMLTFGICSEAPLALANYSMTLMILGKSELAVRLGT